MTFRIQVLLPYSKLKVRIKQFTNAQYKVLIKGIINKNYDECESIIEDLLSECCDVNINEINYIDKLILLLHLRCISVGDVLSQTVKGGEIKYSVSSIIEKIVNTTIDQKQITIHAGETTIQLHIPKKIFINVHDTSCFISTVSTRKTIHHKVDENIRDIIEDILPGSILPILLRSIATLNHSINNIEILKMKKEIESGEIISIYLPFACDDMFNLIYMLFYQHLTNILTKQFILSKEHNINCEYYDSMPPVESEIFFSFHKEIIEESRKEANNTQPQSIPIGFDNG